MQSLLFLKSDIVNEACFAWFLFPLAIFVEIMYMKGAIPQRYVCGAGGGNCNEE